MSKKSSKRKRFLSQFNQKFLQENNFLIGGLILGLTLLLIGIFQLVSDENGTEIEILPPTANGSEQTTQGTGELIVDVAGAINKPGVYRLKPGARVGTAIEAAGGFSEKADFGWVAKNLNLAAKLQDAAKIYVPAKGETAFSTFGNDLVATSSKVNLNTATQSQLESLPAVGPVTAAKIISSRPYTSTEELLTKKVVGKATFDKIKDLISVF